MAGSSSSSIEEALISIDDGIARTSSHQQQQLSTSTSFVPSSVEESQPHEEEEEEEEKVPKFQVNIFSLIGGLIFWVLIATVLANKEKIHILEFDLWKWCLLLMVIFFGIGVIIQFHSEFTIEARSDSTMLIRDLFHDFKWDNSVFFLLLVVFIVWMSLFNRRVSSKTETRILHYLTKTLAALLIGSFLWTLRTRLVLTVASKFQSKDFLDNIADALSNKYLLKALSRPMTREEDAAAAAPAAAGDPHRASLSPIIFSEIPGERWAILISLSTEHLLKAFPILSRFMGPYVSLPLSFFPMRENIGLVVSEGSKGVEKLRTYVKITKKKEKQSKKGFSYRTLLFLTHNVLETQLSIIHNPSDDIARETDFKITNEWEAETAADQIFSNVAKTDPKYMNRDELLRILPKKDVKTLHSQVHGPDYPSNGPISKIALRQWVLKVFREHKSLTSSSNYHNAVVKQLNQFMAWVLLPLVVIIWLLLIGCPTPKIQVFLSLLLGASFIFGNTCKNIFEGIIYVVFMHPFDIGDLCVVDDGQVLVVEGGDIYRTDFSDVDTDEKVFYPNSLLCSKPIKNYTRSPDMKETLEIIIDNPGQQLQDQKGFIEKRIVEYLKLQAEQWQPLPVLHEMKETVDAEKLTIVLHCFRKMSLQNWKERVSQKNMLKMEIEKITDDLRLKFHMTRRSL